MDHLRKWHPVRNLAIPGMKLRVRKADGEIVDGIRPRYIGSYNNTDKGYETLEGEKITDPIEWAIK